MRKPTFEIFKRNETQLGVIAKTPRLASKLNKAYKRYSNGKFESGEEVLFWVPVTDWDRLKTLLRIRGPIRLELVD